MFETLFKHPRVLARHCGGPAADARERFLIHRANEGMARNTLLRTASELLVIAKHIDVTKGTAIGIHQVEIAAAQWTRHQRRRGRAHGPRWPRELLSESPAVGFVSWIDGKSPTVNLPLAQISSEILPTTCETSVAYPRPQYAIDVGISGSSSRG